MSDDLIMLELKEIKGDTKSTLEKVTSNSLAIARVEGSVELHAVQIVRNEKDIALNVKSIGKVRESVKNMMVRVAGVGGGIGAIAGYLASLLG